MLRVSDRTVRNWESGTTRIPYAAYKLLRILRGGRLLGPEWSGWVVQGNRMWTPEGRVIEAGGMAWWSLIVRMARAFQSGADGRRKADTACGSVPCALFPVDTHLGTVAASSSSLHPGVPQPHGLVIEPVNGSRRLPPSNRGVSELRNRAVDSFSLSCECLAGGDA